MEEARRWRRVLAAATGVAVGCGLFYGGNSAYSAVINSAPCGAGCVTAGSRSLGSSAAVQSAEKGILKENEKAVSSGSYVSVALLDPFTYITGGNISPSRILDELSGAALAQRDANQLARESGGVQVQLLLANEGTSSQEGEAQAVARIESLEGPDRIVAVAGMGLSAASTQAAASELLANGMPMFGAVTTGDQFNGTGYPGFFYQVVPDVGAQVQALREALGTDHVQPAALISSDQATDLYSTNLRTDFETAFGGTGKLPEFPFTPATASEQFAGMAMRICASQGQSRLVLYAGREADLPYLVQEFQQSAICEGQPVTIVTGSDANAFHSSDTKSQPGIPGATVTIDYADIVDGARIKGQELKSAANKNDVCTAQPDDPWEVATYESVTAAADALRTPEKPQSKAKKAPAPARKPQAGMARAPEIPTKEIVAANAANQYFAPSSPAIGGAFRFINGELVATTGVPVYQDSGKTGSCTAISRGT